jgi:hypothetical protein
MDNHEDELDVLVPREQKEHAFIKRFLEELIARQEQVENHIKSAPDVPLEPEKPWKDTSDEFTRVWAAHCDQFKIANETGRTTAELMFIYLCWLRMVKKPGMATDYSVRLGPDRQGKKLLGDVYYRLLRVGTTLKGDNDPPNSVIDTMWHDIAALICIGVGSEVTDEAIGRFRLGFDFDIGDPEDEWKEEDQDLGNSNMQAEATKAKEEKEKKKDGKDAKSSSSSSMVDDDEEEEPVRIGPMGIGRMPNDAKESKEKESKTASLSMDKRNKLNEVQQSMYEDNRLESDARTMLTQIALSNFITLATRVYFELEYERMFMAPGSSVGVANRIVDAKEAVHHPRVLSTKKLDAWLLSYTDASSADPPKSFGIRMSSWIYRQITPLGAAWGVQRSKGSDVTVRLWSELYKRDGTYCKFDLTSWIQNASKLVGEAVRDEKHHLHDIAVIVVLSTIFDATYKLIEIVPNPNSAADIEDNKTNGAFMSKFFVWRDQLRARSPELRDTRRGLARVTRLPFIVQMGGPRKFWVHAIGKNDERIWIRCSDLKQAFLVHCYRIRQGNQCKTEYGGDLKKWVEMFLEQ